MLGEELALGASPPLARRSRFAAPSHAAAAAVSLRATCRRGSPAADMLCSDVAVCSAIRLGGSTLPSSRRPATGPDSISCRRWSTLAPPPWRRVLPAGPRPSPLRSTAGRRAALVLTSAHAPEACLEACSAACPLHCLWARGDVRLSSELSPPLRRRERRRYHRVAARGAPALPIVVRQAGDTVAACAPRLRAPVAVPSLREEGGGVRSRVRAPDHFRGRLRGGRPSRRSALHARCAVVASPASLTRASRSALGRALAEEREPPSPSLTPCSASAALTRRRRYRLAPRDATLVFARRQYVRRRCGLQCDPPR